MRRFSVLLFLPALVAAQTTVMLGGTGGPPPPQNTAPPTPVEDLCTVEGQVLNAATGAPLKKATISLMRTDMIPGEQGMSMRFGATSDAEGKFIVNAVEPGRYRLTATRNGYVQSVYGARSMNRPGTMLALARKQHMKDIVFRMTPHGVIAGRVIDQDGDPVPNVRVTLQMYRYIQGRKQLSNAGGSSNSTNDLGEYRVFGIAPGKYLLSAVPMAMNNMMVDDRTAANGQEEDYVTTFYPSGVDASTAAQLEVAPGALLRGIDLTLSKMRTVHVKGHVTYGLPGRHSVQVFITPRSPGGFMGSLRNNMVDAKGNFDIRNVSPGSYNLTAVINEGNQSYQGRLPIEVGANAVEGININIGTGVTLTGHLRIDGDPGKVDLTTIRLNLNQKDPGGIMFGSMPQGKVGEDGNFEFKDASPDTYAINVGGMPAGFYIKSMRTDQADVLAVGLDASSGAAPKVEIVISPNAAQVSGTVQNAATGNPSPTSTVVLIPQEKERRETQLYYRMSNSDQNGSFTFRGIPPGEYKAYAWEDVEMGAYMDPEFMKPIEGKGEVVSLQEGDKKTIQLKVIPAASPAGGM